MFDKINVLEAVVIFLITYGFIISERINRTSAALFGAALMVCLKVLPQRAALGAIDFNTVGLLIGMMIIVTITRRTGVFQYLAIRAARLAGGDPWRILVLFVVITATSSALLDNVTTVLLIAPVTLVITDILELSPIPFLIPEILASNIGGTATLIGDPPNIMIGGATGLGFVDFLINLFPVALIVLLVVLIVLRFLYGRHLGVSEEARVRVMNLDPMKEIADGGLLIKSLIVISCVMLGFVSHQYLGYDSATVALAGASLLLVISELNPEDVLLEVEWGTIFFFLGLFILVGGLERVGVIEVVARKMVDLTGGSICLTAFAVLWISAIASAFIDNVPFVATMIPLIKSVGALSGMDVIPLWWALALGACLGGNGSLIGASANVIVAGMVSDREERITFGGYLRVGLPVMILSMTISSLYLMVRYL